MKNVVKELRKQLIENLNINEFIVDVACNTSISLSRLKLILFENMDPTYSEELKLRYYLMSTKMKV